MKRLLTGLGITLLGSVVGCTDSTPAEDCQPGDIDCAAPDSGKADGFGGDRNNDPQYFSQHLEYKLESLPKKGWRDTPYWKDQYPEAVGKAATVWADTYWPASEGSHNYRWQGSDVPSPLEKYDAAFNNKPGCATQPAISGPGAKAAWDTYNACAGPAASWQTENYESIGLMHNGLDDDHDGTTDDYGSDGIDGVQGWWGSCHAWTPASELVPEPQHAVTIDGTTFEVGDIKALIQNAFDRTSAVMLGGRCNAKTITHDVHGSANDDCADVNPGSLYVIMGNFLGINQLPLIEDKTANYEVWNQPVVGYEITKQDPITPAEANKLVGADGDTWTYNAKAKDLYDVKMTVSYVTEGSPGTTPIGYRNNVRTDSYHYILEVSGDGKVIGGRYCADTEDSHIDFLWSPTGQWSASNPHVDASKVKELIAKSVAPLTTQPTGPSVEFSAMPSAAIPDNDPKGVAVDVAVTGVAAATGLTVSVNISHTYRGDLVIDLLHDGAKVKNLVSNKGGSQHDIVESYTVDAASLASPNGTWTVHVVDTAAQDSGTVNSVKLDFAK